MQPLNGDDYHINFYQGWESLDSFYKSAFDYLGKMSVRISCSRMIDKVEYISLYNLWTTSNGLVCKPIDHNHQRSIKHVWRKYFTKKTKIKNE